MEKTYLLDCRIIDPAVSAVWEDGLLSLHHGDAAPDPIGYCGPRQAADAPDYLHPEPGDNPLSLENATLLPGFIDVGAVLLPESAESLPAATLSAYRKAAAMLRYGVMSVGVSVDSRGVLKALMDASNQFQLWLPLLCPTDKNGTRPGYCVFRGLPNKGTLAEEQWLEQANRASALGMKPVLSTGDAPLRQPDGALTLVHMAALLTEGGFSNMEALQALTSNAAELLSITGRTGRLCAGYEGDVLAVQGNPLEDIFALRNCVMHARGGRLTWSGLKGFSKTNFALLPPGYEL